MDRHLYMYLEEGLLNLTRKRSSLALQSMMLMGVEIWYLIIQLFW